MARDKSLFKMLVNRLLDHLDGMAIGAELGSETGLAAELGASRTTVRAALGHLADAGVVSWDGRRKRLVRRPRTADRFDTAETRPQIARIEEPFLTWVLHGDLPPGTTFSEAELARRFQVPTATVREFLIRFAPFGLIEKRPNRHWVLKGFTRDFAEEMFAVRELFERHALPRLIAACAADPVMRDRVQALADDHGALIAGPDSRLDGFNALDARFHQVVCTAARNRFMLDFSRTISIIVHFHYRWNKHDELRRNRAALIEHLSIIDAVLTGDAEAAADALDRHLATARQSLMQSVIWGRDDPARPTAQISASDRAGT